MAIDAAALLFLSITSVLFLAAAVYAVGYLAGESRPGNHHGRRGGTAVRELSRGRLCRMPAVVSGDHDAGGRQPPLGPDVGGRRSHHLGQRPVDLLPSPSPFARSHVEIPADLFGGHRPGAVGQFLRRRGRAVRRRADDPSDHRRPGCPRRQPESALAQGGVSLLPGRLRNEDGAGAAAHLAARRPQRGPLGRFRAALRGTAELRFPDDSPQHTRCCRPPAWPTSAPICWCSSA